MSSSDSSWDPLRTTLPRPVFSQMSRSETAIPSWSRMFCGPSTPTVHRMTGYGESDARSPLLNASGSTHSAASLPPAAASSAASPTAAAVEGAVTGKTCPVPLHDPPAIQWIPGRLVPIDLDGAFALQPVRRRPAAVDRVRVGGARRGRPLERGRRCRLGGSRCESHDRGRRGARGDTRGGRRGCRQLHHEAQHRNSGCGTAVTRAPVPHRCSRVRGSYFNPSARSRSKSATFSAWHRPEWDLGVAENVPTRARHRGGALLADSAEFGAGAAQA